MISKGNDFKKLIPSENREEYLSALKEFTQMTIQDPTFFEKTPEDQKEIAFATLQEHKEKKDVKQNEK